MKRKLLAAVAGTAMALSAVSPLPLFAETESESFSKWMEEEFVETMENDFLSMHYSVIDYEAYGIEKPELNVGSASWDDYEEGAEDVKETLDELEAFDYSKLTAEQQHDYDAYHFYLKCMEELYKYPYLDFWFSPGEGIIDNLTTNFTEYKFYSQQDIDDYLAVLDTVDEYINGALEITQKQAAEGYFLTDAALDSTLDSINKFVEKTDDNALIIIFDQNVDAFEGLSDEQREEYKARNREIVLNTYIPAYSHAGEVLSSLRGSRKYGDAVCDLPDGEKYYAALASLKSSNSMSVQELVDTGNAFLEKAVADYIKIIYSVEDDSVLDSTVEFESPEEVLTYLQNHLDEFPKGPEVTFTVNYLDPSVANDSITAYYLSPPIDNLKDNVIKINGDNVGNINDLYSTLAHEGFPGHLYQITWYMNTNPSPLRTQINMIGYTEGWAMYSEGFAFDFSGLAPEAAEYNKLNVNLNYVLDAVCDLGVNGLGWGVTSVENWLDELGLNSSIAQDLYDFVTENPAQIVPYGMGLVEFYNLQERAEKAMGSSFDLTEYLEVILTYGDRPFDVVRKDVDAYLLEKTGTVPTESPDTIDPEPEPEPKPEEEPLSWMVYAGIGGGTAAALAIAVVLGNKARKRNPLA